jgi:acyl carrier protein
MATEESLIDRVRHTVVDALGLAVEARALDPDEPLFGGDATVDSLGSLEIVAALEREFGIQITDDELGIELFDSVRSLAACVRRHLDPAPPSVSA